MLKEIDLICWGTIKVKILYKISGMKFCSLELKLCGFVMKPPRMKGLKLQFKARFALPDVLRRRKHHTYTIHNFVLMLRIFLKEMLKFHIYTTIILRI